MKLSGRLVAPIVIVLIGCVVISVGMPALFEGLPVWALLTLQWVGTIACVIQSALCSGLTVGLTGINRLELEAMAMSGNEDAKAVSKIRETPFLLPFTLLWGNVIFNVALPLLVNGMFPAWAAFLFSTVVITHLGELLPVAIVSRYPLAIGAFLAPAVRVYTVLLWPIARVEAYLLERILGPEEVPLFSEQVLHYMLERHVKEETSQIGLVEGIGAQNFLEFDDTPVANEGELLVPESIIPVRVVNGEAQLHTDEAFLQRVFAPRKKWVLLTDEATGEPICLLDARDFVAEARFSPATVTPKRFCHRPLIVRDGTEKLGPLLARLKVKPEHAEDDVIDHDAILLWTEHPKIITGSDILGRLLRRIVQREPASRQPQPAADR